MNILLSSDWYSPAVNGVVSSVKALSKGLILRGHNVLILTLSNDRNYHEEENVIYLPSVSVSKLYPGARLSVMYPRKAYRRILDFKPDVIHTNCEFSTFLISKRIAKKLNIPIVHTFHTVYEDYIHYFCPSTKLGKMISRYVVRKASSISSLIIVPSAKTREMVLRSGGMKTIRVIPSAVDIERLSRYDIKLREEIEKRAGDVNALKLLVLSRLAKEKNIDEILIYLSHIRNVNFVLFIVGDGPYRKNLEDLTKKLNLCGKVLFFGQADPNDVSSYYHACDVFLSSSKSETQGLCYAEALSSHIPVIARKDDAISGVVIDGENGFQYETEEEFRKSLMFFYEDRKQIEVFGKRAFESSLIFSIDTFSYRVEKAYLDAIGKVLS